VPYYRLGKEVKNLKFEEELVAKSRVETEKNYFLRKIDEKTFRAIISEKQSQIYKITTGIKMKEQAQLELLHHRLNPVYFGKWLMKKRTKQTNFNGKVIS
jgi:hypothetical protein